MQLDTTTALYIISSVATIVGGLILYIFAGLVRQTQRIEGKLDSFQISNQKDHDEVVKKLLQIEGKIETHEQAMQSFQDRLDRMEELKWWGRRTEG